MKHSNVSKIKLSLQFILLLALLSISFSSSYTLRGSALDCPTNDDFDCATAVGAFPYTNSISTTSATMALDDPQVNVICDSRLLKKGAASVWYRYQQTSGTNKNVSFDTIGSNYDTYIAVWTGTRGSLTLIGCDDDTYAGLQSQFSLSSISNTTYYIEVAQYNGEQSALVASLRVKPDIQTQAGGNLVFRANDNANTDVYIAGSFTESYALPILSNTRDSYAGTNNGPVVVESTNGLPIIASERVAYTPDGGSTWTTFDEMMGMPAEQLSDTYYFPYYNNVEMNTQLRVGNVGNVNTNVTVTIGGVVQGVYTVTPNQSVRLAYPLSTGPVKVQSSNGVPIVASMRFARIQSTNPLVVPAFTEMMGLPVEQLTSSYVFPYYNNIEMNTQLRVGNVGNVTTNVTVTIGGVVQGVYTVTPSQSLRLAYPLNSGPVKIQSSNGVPIITSMRFVRIQSPDPLVVSYFSEMMGLPLASVGNDYFFPAYDNVTHNMQLRFGNLGTLSTDVTVTIAGVVQGTYTVAPSQSLRLAYPLNSGPLEVKSSNGTPIIASIRFAYIESQVPLVVGAFSEMLGLPAEQMSNIYVFPWYNNTELDTQLRLAVP